MKKVFYIILLFISAQASSQQKTAADFGYRYFKTSFQNDTVEILIKSKKGDENKRKPLFLFCQGSLPIPLIIYDEEGGNRVFPFDIDSLCEDFHLAIIGKPSIPVIAHIKELNSDMTFFDPITKKFPNNYSKKNYLNFYVVRNITAIKFLQNLPFISNNKLVVAGHSEGSTIAAKLALKCKKITHLIYASGNPLGRIQSIINQSRMKETEEKNSQSAEANFLYWQYVVKNKNSFNDSLGDSFKTTYDFSYPPIRYLIQLKIPVYICYGTKDYAAPFNDYFRAEIIRQQKVNFTFKAYFGLEHNFFPVKENGEIDYSKFNWDSVMLDWAKWLKK